MSLSQDSLIGKRKKKKEPIPNPLFVQWITNWRDDAASKGIKSQYTYNKALQTLKKFPARLSSGRECKFLENFGDKICGMLDEKLSEYVAQYGTTEPVEGYLTIPVPAKKRKTTAKQSNTDYDDLNFDNLRVPPPPGGPSGGRGATCLGADSGSEDECTGGARPQQPVRQRRNTGNRQPREYIPQYRSGPYALLITLFKHQRSGGSHMSKRDLLQEAQPLADKSFTIPDPGSRYTAWSSMGSLINKGLIVKQNNPAKYHLTDTGCALAVRVLDAERDGQFGLGASSVNDELRFRLGDGPRAARPVTTNHTVPCATAVRDDDDDDDDVMIVDCPMYGDMGAVDRPVFEETYPETGVSYAATGLDIESDEGDDSSCGLQFHYIDEAGNEVSHKDKASVTVDEEISVGFLIRCAYEDLLMSGRRYKLDTTRHTIGDDIFAYMADDDAPDISTKARKELKNKQPIHRPHTVTTNSASWNNNKHMPNHNKVMTSPGCNDIAPLYTGPRPTVTQSSGIPSFHNDIERPTTIADCRPKTKPKQVNVAPKAPTKVEIPRKICEPDVFRLPDLPSQNSQSVPSLSGDSQSQDSTSGGRSTATNDNPEFVLRPGKFEVILCVDNQEFYGGGSDSKKQVIVKELERHKVPHHIRPLHIGDFCWVARDNAGGHELVLDYIIERKRMDDLAGSIIDGRFKEQKFRLRSCGLNHPIYLVEDYGSSQHFSIAEDALFQAIANTQIIDNFYVKRTSDSRESAAYLTLMTRYLQSLHANKTLCAVSKSQLDSSKMGIGDRHGDQEICLMKFDEFNQASVKTKAYTVKEMFGKQLCQLHGLTVEKAAVILEKYPTPTCLIKAYRSCISEKDKVSLLANIKFGPTQKNVGAAVSKSVYYMYNTTEGKS